MSNNLTKRPIRIWEYEDAPKKYKNLFYSDDADYIAFIPKELWVKSYEYIWFLGYEHWREDEEIILSDGILKICRHS